MTAETDKLFNEWRRLVRIARISCKKGDAQKAEEAHRVWKAALVKLGKKAS